MNKNDISSTLSPDFDLNNYQFDLPEENIAQNPAPSRSSSRLLVLDRSTGKIKHSRFANLIDFLPPDCLLVANNSRVLPARLEGRKDSGGRVEFLLLTPLPLIQAMTKNNIKKGIVRCLLKASRALKTGAKISLGENLAAEVMERHPFGRYTVQLEWTGNLAEIFLEYGQMPLPPYIRRPNSSSDRQRYQTTYANNEKLGSVAAPTAGLHFTPAQKQELEKSGRRWAEVSLYVGYGTFSPVRSRDIREHGMHSEYAEISERTARELALAKQENRKIICIGTTTVRTLEGAYAQTGALTPFRGWIDIFITPGFEFRLTDHMLTNFHLPGSSLIIMVAALTGRDTILNAYKQAVEEGYRFFSYGDAMLIL
ncbi:MAG: tRNA preQ1(34) S-adenosylmethionine ribosyltransferase-isomerase QueA [Desulfovibrionales bacterium]